MTMTSSDNGEAQPPRALPNGWLVEQMSRSETDYLYREIVTDRLYESPIIGTCSGLVVDVGANIGLFSLQAVARWSPEWLVSIEAIPDVRDVLRRNLARNLPPGAATKVVVADVAAGAIDGISEFTFYPAYSMMSGRLANPTDDLELVGRYVTGQLGNADEAVLSDLDDVLRNRFEPEQRRVQVAPLSAICAVTGRSTIDLLKIDVEGDELTVLEGLDDLRVRNAVVEVDSRRSSVSAVRARLEALGLAVTEVTQEGYEGLPLCVLVGRSQ